MCQTFPKELMKKWYQLFQENSCSLKYIRFIYLVQLKPFYLHLIHFLQHNSHYEIFTWTYKFKCLLCTEKISLNNVFKEILYIYKSDLFLKTTDTYLKAYVPHTTPTFSLKYSIIAIFKQIRYYMNVLIFIFFAHLSNTTWFSLIDNSFISAWYTRINV